MLKIKDNVDLKELEKFGFDSDEYDDYYYDFIPYKPNDGEYILVENETRELYVDYFGIDYMREAVELLYDLIKADLVEKVEEQYESNRVETYKSF